MHPRKDAMVKGGKAVKKKKAAVLVCVTGQRDCDRLIRVGKKLAEEQALPMQVLCVQPQSAGYGACSEELEYLYQTAREAGAEMTIIFQDDSPLVAAGFIRQIGAVHVVTGMAGFASTGFIEVLHSIVPRIPISMVSKEEVVYNMYPVDYKSQNSQAISAVCT